jgi:hypothetical protein
MENKGTVIISRRHFLRSAAFLAGGLALSVGTAAKAAEKTAAALSDAGKTLLDYMKDRIASVYAREKTMPKRSSQDNPEIIQLYEDFLGSPMSGKAEQYLHRELSDRSAPLKKLRKKSIYPYKRLSAFSSCYPFERGT